MTDAVKKDGELDMDEHVTVEGWAFEDWVISNEVMDMIEGMWAESNFLLETGGTVLLVPPEEPN